MSLGNMEQESYYDVVENSVGDLMIAVKSRTNQPVKPKLIYDNGEHALFYRTKKQIILLDFLHPEVRPTLNKVKSVLFVEFEDDDIIREYDVPVRHLSRLPLSDSDIKSLTGQLEE